MGSLNDTVVLVTGASSGIGKALAEYLAAKGCRVYGTSRRAPAEGTDVAAGAGGGTNKAAGAGGGTNKAAGAGRGMYTDSGTGDGFLKMIRLDVCSDESVSQAVNHVLDKEGRLDVLINNAGFGIIGSVEDTTLEEAKSQLETNFFGAVRMCRAVLPSMRHLQNGMIINISSVGGFIALPFQSMYSASKYALEAFTEVLRIEVKVFGVRVALVEPGDTRTGFTDNRQFCNASKDGSVYRQYFLKSLKGIEKAERTGPPPGDILKTVDRLIRSKNPPVRRTVGIPYKLIKQALRIIPDRLLEFCVSKWY